MSGGAGNWPLPSGAHLSQLVREWLDLARADVITAERELAAATDLNYAAVCFHAQQAVEKLMKAVLLHYGVVAPYTHDLIALDELLVATLPHWTWPSADLRRLVLGAVSYRYPGPKPTQQQAEDAMDVCRRIWPALTAML